MTYILFSILIALSGCNSISLSSSSANAEGVGPLASTPATLAVKTEAAASFPAAPVATESTLQSKAEETAVAEEITVQAPPPDFLAASQILVSYVGAKGATKRVKRSKASALTFARRLSRSGRARPRRFSNLARKNSDGPARGRGGYLGVWKRGTMYNAFETAVIATAIDSVSNEVVESPYGFHVIRRRPLPKLISASSILVAYKGAMRAADSVVRSRADAKKRAMDIVRETKVDVLQFASLAKQYSDAPHAARGGQMGVWRVGQMLPDIDTAVSKLELDAISKPIETPFGFYVLKGQLAEPSAGVAQAP